MESFFFFFFFTDLVLYQLGKGVCLSTHVIFLDPSFDLLKILSLSFTNERRQTQILLKTCLSTCPHQFIDLEPYFLLSIRVEKKKNTNVFSGFSFWPEALSFSLRILITDCPSKMLYKRAGCHLQTIND
jgi:hypothetical protein